MKELKIIKIGGNVIDNPSLLSKFLVDFSKLSGRKILVHGGGKIATKMAASLGYEAQIIDGKRITDDNMLKVATMVYGGLLNKQIVAGLQSEKCNAIGLSGADANIISSIIRPIKDGVDYGYVGDINKVSADNLDAFLNIGFVPVLAPLTHDGKGQLLNTNADNIASHIAMALSALYKVSLIYTFEFPGVLADLDNPATKYDSITLREFNNLKEQKIVHSGMIAKLEACFKAIENGADEVIICHASDIAYLNTNSIGTKFIKS